MSAGSAESVVIKRVRLVRSRTNGAARYLGKDGETPVYPDGYGGRSVWQLPDQEPNVQQDGATPPTQDLQVHVAVLSQP